MADRKNCAGCLRDEESIPAESWCTDCWEAVCTSCTKFHKKLSPPHSLLPIDQALNLCSSIIHLSRACSNHSDQKMLFFCCQHDQLICDSCVPESHQHCTPIISIDKAAKDVRTGTTMSGLEKRFENITKTTEALIDEQTENVSNLEETVYNIKKRISETKLNMKAKQNRSKMHDHYDNVAEKLLNEVEMGHNEIVKVTAKTNCELKAKHNSVLSLEADLKSLKPHTSEIPLFLVVKYLEVETHKYELQIRDFIQNEKLLNISFRPADSNIQSLSPILGSVEIVKFPISVSFKEDEQAQIFVGNTLGKLSLLLSFKTQKLGDKDLKIYRGCFTCGNKLILSVHYRKCICVCNVDGTESRFVQLKTADEGVALFDKNTAVVAAGVNGIQIIDLTTMTLGSVLKFGRYCKAISCLNGEIWTRSDNKILTLVDINGKVLKTLTVSFDPWDICLGKNGKIYYTGFCKDEVYVVTSDGDEAVLYSSPELKGTRDLAIDNNGDIYVTGRSSNNIHKISSDGQKHSIILNENDGIHEPTAITFNQETKQLMILNNYDKTILIYQKT